MVSFSGHCDARFGVPSRTLYRQVQIRSVACSPSCLGDTALTLDIHHQCRSSGVLSVMYIGLIVSLTAVQVRLAIATTAYDNFMAA